MIELALAATVVLNGLWDFRLAEQAPMEEVRLPDFAADDKMIVPGCWDAMNDYFDKRGTGCYRRTFTLEKDVVNAFLVVDGCCLRSKYWIDGREIGFSKLPWSRIEFATGPLAAGEHVIVAAVDSLTDEAKVKLFHDFYDFYAPGGFHHGVWLELQTTPVEIRRLVVRTRDYRTGLVEIEALYAQEGASDFTASVSFDGKPAKDIAFRNRRATVTVPDFRLWSPEHPNLHTVTIKQCSARFGIRAVGTASKRITLNGEPVYIKGVNRHESHWEFGATTPRQLMYDDIRTIKDLGCNFIRGSHYAQCEEFLDLCDELGVLVWEESLGWGNREDQLKDPEFCALQVEQTRLMARQSINHPCVIVSGFLNEPAAETEACKALVKTLTEALRTEDTGHLVAYATCRNDNDISHGFTDIIAYNAYPCQYVHTMKRGTDAEMRKCIRDCHEEIVRYFRDTYKDERPIIVSETGIKADYGMRDPRGKAQNTEDFQAQYEKMMLEELFDMPEVAGVVIWQYGDTKTYTRVGYISSRPYGVNTGGLFDIYRRPKLTVDVVRELFRGKREK